MDATGECKELFSGRFHSDGKEIKEMEESPRNGRKHVVSTTIDLSRSLG
jgi:hypothetical protein